MISRTLQAAGLHTSAPRIAVKEVPKVQKRPWIAPTVQDLPRLTELTLVTGAGVPGDGDIGGGGSTVIP